MHGAQLNVWMNFTAFFFNWLGNWSKAIKTTAFNDCQRYSQSKKIKRSYYHFIPVIFFLQFCHIFNFPVFFPTFLLLLQFFQINNFAIHLFESEIATNLRIHAHKIDYLPLICQYIFNAIFLCMYVCFCVNGLKVPNEKPIYRIKRSVDCSINNNHVIAIFYQQ